MYHIWPYRPSLSWSCCHKGADLSWWGQVFYVRLEGRIPHFKHLCFGTKHQQEVLIHLHIQIHKTHTMICASVYKASLKTCQLTEFLILRLINPFTYKKESWKDCKKISGSLRGLGDVGMSSSRKTHLLHYLCEQGMIRPPYRLLPRAAVSV